MNQIASSPEWEGATKPPSCRPSIPSATTPVSTNSDMGTIPQVDKAHEPSFLTVLRDGVGDAAASKTFSIYGDSSYGNAKWFVHDEAEITDLDSLWAALSRLQGAPCTFVVAGRVKSEFKSHQVIRRLAREKPDARATIEDTPTRILHFDIDNTPLPEGTSWDDPATAAAAVWNALGENNPALARADCIWQASSSAGVGEKAHLARFHFWALADVPLRQDERRALYKLVGSDPVLAGIVQPQYTAPPRFVGRPDPFEGRLRLGRLRGPHSDVRVSGLDLHPQVKPTASEAHFERPAPTFAPAQRSERTTAFGQAVLDGICADLATITEGRNSAINSKSYQVALWVNGGEIEQSQAYADLSQAAQATGHERWGDALSNGFNAGLNSGEALTAPEPVGFEQKQRTTTRLFPTDREFFEAFEWRYAPQGDSVSNTLIAAPDHTTAATMAEAGYESWVLKEAATSFEGETSSRPIVFLLPKPEEIPADAVSHFWGQAMAHQDRAAFACVPDLDSTVDEIDQAITAAIPWEWNPDGDGDHAPVDLVLPTFTGPANDPQEPQEAIRDRESVRLRTVLAQWVNTHSGAAYGRLVLQDAYAEIDDRLALEAWLDPREYHRRKVREQKQAREKIKEEMGLAELPKLRRRGTAGLDAVGATHARIAITGSQGIGKTATLVGGHGKAGALHEANGAISLMLFPTLEKASEAFDDYQANATANSPTPLLLRGRGALDAQGQPMCMIPKTAEIAAKRGANVRRDVCERCPFFAQCGHIAQEAQTDGLKDTRKGAVIFGTHPYLTLPLPSGIVPDLIICDEKPADMASHVKVPTVDLTLSTSQLLESCGLGRLGRNAVEIADNLEQLKSDLKSAVEPLLTAIGAGLGHWSGCLAYLRDQGFRRPQIETAIAALGKLKDNTVGAAVSAGGVFATPSDMDEVCATRLTATAPLKVGKLLALLEAVLIEIASPKDWPVGFALRGETIHVWVAKGAFHENAPLCYLDGTANMAVAENMFGSAFAEHRFSVPRKARVTQIKGKSFSDSSITGRGRAGHWANESQKLRTEIRDLIETRKGCFVAGTKAVLTALGGANLDCRFGNFGALRGVNSFSQCSAAVIVGRALPRPEVFSDMARPYAARRGLSLTEVSEYAQRTDLAITDARDEPHRIESPYHPDELAEAFRSQTCEAEIEQAVDRLRLIHCDGVREVFLLNNHPTIKADRVLSWGQLVAGGSDWDKVAAKGFLPASSREAARLLGDVWGSKSAADRAFKEVDFGGKKLSQTPYNNYMGSGTLSFDSKFPPIALKYKSKPTPKAPRPRFQLAYVWGIPREQARDHVETFTGPLQAFEIITQDAMQ